MSYEVVNIEVMPDGTWKKINPTNDDASKRISELEARLAAAQADTAILDWLADYQVLEGFVPVDYDVHEVAGWIADERDVDAEPSVEDYRQALRRLVRAAMDE